MKFCGYCGTELPDTSHFCPKCGKPFADTVDFVPAEDTSIPSAPPKPRKRGVFLALAAVLVVLVVLAAAVLVCIKPFSENANSIEEAAQSVVMLSCYDKEDNLISTGSGFVAIADDLVVTNYHVVDFSVKITVSTEQDKSYKVASVVAYDETKDVAILQLAEKTGLPLLPLGDSYTIKKGEKVTAIGSPLGIKNTVSNGILSGRFRSDENDFDALQFTAPISSGSSGGALFNESGKVIGITYASLINGQNLNLAIPIEQVQSVYAAKSEKITLEALCEKSHPGYDYFLDSILVTYSDLVKQPEKYNGKLISVVGYAVHADAQNLTGNRKYNYRLFLLPAEEYKIWEDEPTTKMLDNTEVGGYIYHWAYNSYSKTYMIKCDDPSHSLVADKYINTNVVVSGLFAYEESNENMVASMELMYIGSSDSVPS